jgi:hypothetical protein
MLKLLGIHFAQFPESWELHYEGNGSKTTKSKRKRTHLITDGAYVEGMSGMTCVIPAWKILEVLNLDKFKEQRRVAELERKQKRRKSSNPKPESSGDKSSVANPMHQEDFSRLLNVAAQKPKPSGQT